MAVLNWLDRLLFGVRFIFFGDDMAELPDRPALWIKGNVGVQDDPQNNATVLDFSAVAGAVDSVTAVAPLANTGTGSAIVLELTGVISDEQHGEQPGGALHAEVIADGAAGFMSGADKTKLDAIPPAASIATTSYVDSAVGGLSAYTAADSSITVVSNQIAATGTFGAKNISQTGSTSTTAGSGGFIGVKLDYVGALQVGPTDATSIAIGHGTITLSLTGVTDSILASIGSTKTAGRQLRNTTAATNVATLQVAPSDVDEGRAWVSGANRVQRIRRSTVTRTSGNVDWLAEYDKGDGSGYSTAFYYTTASPNQLAALFYCYCFGAGSDGYIFEGNASGMLQMGNGGIDLVSRSSDEYFRLRSNADGSNERWRFYAYAEKTDSSNTLIGIYCDDNLGSPLWRASLMGDGVWAAPAGHTNTAYTADHAVTFEDSAYFDCTGGVRSGNLPAGGGVTNRGRRLRVWKVDGGPNRLYLVPNGSETIDGVNASVSTATAYGFIEVEWNGSGWLVGARK